MIPSSRKRSFSSSTLCEQSQASISVYRPPSSDFTQDSSIYASYAVLEIGPQDNRQVVPISFGLTVPYNLPDFHFCDVDGQAGTMRLRGEDLSSISFGSPVSHQLLPGFKHIQDFLPTIRENYDKLDHIALEVRLTLRSQWMERRPLVVPNRQDHADIDVAHSALATAGITVKPGQLIVLQVLYDAKSREHTTNRDSICARWHSIQHAVELYNDLRHDALKRYDLFNKLHEPRPHFHANYRQLQEGQAMVFKLDEEVKNTRNSLDAMEALLMEKEHAVHKPRHDLTWEETLARAAENELDGNKNKAFAGSTGSSVDSEMKKSQEQKVVPPEESDVHNKLELTETQLRQKEHDLEIIQLDLHISESRFESMREYFHTSQDILRYELHDSSLALEKMQTTFWKLFDELEVAKSDLHLVQQRLSDTKDHAFTITSGMEHDLAKQGPRLKQMHKELEEARYQTAVFSHDKTLLKSDLAITRETLRKTHSDLQDSRKRLKTEEARTADLQKTQADSREAVNKAEQALASSRASHAEYRKQTKVELKGLQSKFDALMIQFKTGNQQESDLQKFPSNQDNAAGQDKKPDVDGPELKKLRAEVKLMESQLKDQDRKDQELKKPRGELQQVKQRLATQNRKETDVRNLQVELEKTKAQLKNRDQGNQDDRHILNELHDVRAQLRILEHQRAAEVALRMAQTEECRRLRNQLDDDRGWSRERRGH